MSARNRALWASLAAGALCVGFLLCRYVFLEMHGMKQWPFLLFIAALLVIAVAAVFSKRRVMACAVIGYIGGFALGMLFQTDGIDPGGGRTNNAWLIWTVSFAVAVLAGVIFEKLIMTGKIKIIAAKERKGVFGIDRNLASVLCIFVFCASWITNMGWIRFIFAIPMAIHAVIFFFSNRAYNKYGRESKSVDIVNRFVYISYLLGYILLPDGGDTSDSVRVVFGLIRHDLFFSIAGVVSELLLLINIILIVVQIVYNVSAKHKWKMENEGMA